MADGNAPEVDALIASGNHLADAMGQSRPDIARAQKLLKWLPRTELAEGLERTVAYFRKKVLG